MIRVGLGTSHGLPSAIRERRRIFWAFVGSVFAVALLFGLSQSGIAQVKKPNRPTVEMEGDVRVFDLTTMSSDTVYEDFQNVPLTVALNRLSHQTNPPTRFVREPADYSGTVTVRIEGLPFDAALYTVLEAARRERSPLSYARVSGRDGEFWRIFPGDLPPEPRVLAWRREWYKNGGRLFDEEIPKLLIQTGHVGRVDGLAISPDGKFLASSGTEGTVNLWHIRSRRIMHTFFGKVGPDAFSSDSKYLRLATGQQIYRLNVATGGMTVIGKGYGGYIFSFAPGPGNSFALQANDFNIRFYKDRGDQNPTMIPAKEGTFGLAYSPQGNLIADWPTGENSNNLEERPDYRRCRLWDTRGNLQFEIRIPDIGRDGKLQKPQTKDDKRNAPLITQVAFRPDGRFLAISTAESMVYLVNLERYRQSNFVLPLYIRAAPQPSGQRDIVPRGHPIGNSKISWSRDGKYLAASGADGTILLFEMVAKPGNYEELTAKTRIDQRDLVASLTFSGNGERLAVGIAHDNDAVAKLRLYDVTANPPTIARQFDTSTRNISGVAVSPDHKLLYVGGTPSTPDAPGIRLWHTGMTAPPRLLEGMAPLRESPDHKRLAVRGTGSAKGGVLLYHMQTAQKQVVLRPSAEAVGEPNHIAFSPSGNLIAAAGWKAGNSEPIYLFGAGNGGQIGAPFVGPQTGTIDYLAFSGDGRYLVSKDSRGTLVVWDTATRNILHTVKAEGQAAKRIVGQEKQEKAEEKPVAEIAAAPDTSDTAVEAQTDRAELPWQNYPRSNPAAIAVSFHPEGRQYIALSDFQSAKTQVYELETGRHLFTVNGTTPVFAPDGTILANTFQLHLDLYDLRAVERIRAKRQFYKENNQTAPPDDPDLQIPRVAHLRNISGLPVFPPHARNGEVVAAVQDNNVVVYSLRGNGWIRTGIDKGHASPVLALAFSESGRVFVSGSADAGVFLWDIKSKPGEREIASFVGVGEADYLVATADNYYMASKGALSRVSFVKEDNVYPFEQFDLRLNRPDLVLAKLGQAPPEMIAAVQEAWERRLRREGYNPDKQKTMRWYVPEIRVTDENRIQEVTHEAALTFTVEAKDEGYRIRSLHVSVNDVPLYGSRGLPVESANLSYPPPDGLGGMVTKQITVPLTAGRNRIQITATNIEGNESRRITYEINRKVSAPEPTTLYIVGIGVSQYKDDRIPDLNLAHKDANDIVELFRAAGSLPPLKAVPPKPTLIGPGLDIERVEYAPRYERVEPILLQDKDATRENILKIREKLLESQPQDHVIFFIAGHGFLDPKEMQYYFAVADTDMGNLGKTGISYAELEGILDGIPARQKLLLMDTCHSGEVDSENIGVLGTASSSDKVRGIVVNRGGAVAVAAGKAGASPNTFQLMRDLFPDLRHGSGAEVITASDGLQLAQESQELGNGVFTKAVLEGLRDGDADSDKNGQITISELSVFVQKRVLELTGGQQRPTARRDTLEFDFPLLLR